MIATDSDIPLVFDCKLLAEIMGVSATTARRMMHAEGFPLEVHGERSHRIYKRKFLAWLEGERFKATRHPISR